MLDFWELFLKFDPKFLDCAYKWLTSLVDGWENETDKP